MPTAARRNFASGGGRLLGENFKRFGEKRGAFDKALHIFKF